ncbi:MAG: Piwi domain-containing protein [Hormoscilla sp.]
MPIRELSFVSQDPIASLPYTRYRVQLNAASDDLPGELGKLARSLKWKHKTAILADITNSAILSPVPLASQDDRYSIIEEESINLAEPRYDRYLFQACNFALYNAFQSAPKIDRLRQRIYSKDRVTTDGMESQRYLKFDFIRDENQHLVLVLDFANEYHSQLTIDELKTLKPGDRLIHSYDDKVCEFVRIDEEKTISTPLSALGNKSIIDYHRQKGNLDDALLNSLDPSTPAVTVKYKNSGKKDFEASHMPQLLRKIYDREDVENSFFNKQLLPIGEKVEKALKSIKFLNDKNRFLLNGTPVKFSESLREPRNWQNFKQKNNLDFGKRIFPYPAAGMKAHKLLEKPEEIRAYILYPQSWESDARRYTVELKAEMKKFGINLKRVDQPYDPLDREQVMQICQDIKEACNFVIAYVPQPGEEYFTREVNPYELIKQEFLKRQLPSQMITKSTLKRGYNEYIGRNVILGINAKLGHLSWRLQDMPGKAQAFIGLDFGRKNLDTVPAAFLIDRTGRTIGWSTAKFPVYREAFDRIQFLDWLRNFVRLYYEHFKCKLQHLVIHRDGDVRDAEMEAISDLQKHVAGIEQVDVVEVIKSGTCRAVEYNPENPNKSSNPEDGYAWEYARNEAVILTTGSRETKVSPKSAPRPLRIRKRMGDTDLLTLAEQVYWLSLMQVGTTQTVRLPITTYYADRAASRALKDLLPPGMQRDRRLWFL